MEFRQDAVDRAFRLAKKGFAEVAHYNGERRALVAMLEEEYPEAFYARTTLVNFPPHQDCDCSPVCNHLDDGGGY